MKNQSDPDIDGVYEYDPDPAAKFFKTRPRLKKLQKNIREIEREKALARRVAARKRYQEENNVTLDSCSVNLDQLDEFATVQLVTLPNGKSREWPVFSATSLAAPLNTTAVTTNRWINNGMLPKPILQASRGLVFHLEEVRVIVQAIGELQNDTKQYRATHTETKDRIFTEIARIRKSILNLAV